MLGTIFVTHRELAQSLPPVRELARRIAYQWWQETVGVRSAEDLWLADGMAYFSAAQYIGKEQGAAAYKEEIDNLAVLALKFEKKSAVREAISLGYRTDKYESVAAGKGAWVLNMLRGILGEQGFDRLIRAVRSGIRRERREHGAVSETGREAKRQGAWLVLFRMD